MSPRCSESVENHGWDIVRSDRRRSGMAKGGGVLAVGGEVVSWDAIWLWIRRKSGSVLSRLLLRLPLPVGA